MASRRTLQCVLAAIGLTLSVSVGAAELSKSAAEGKALAFGRKDGNCLACHVIKGGSLMGDVGPELSDMKARFPNRKFLYQRIYDEQQFNPMTVMPPFGKNKILSKSDLEKIIDFLYTL